MRDLSCKRDLRAQQVMMDGCAAIEARASSSFRERRRQEMAAFFLDKEFWPE